MVLTYLYASHKVLWQHCIIKSLCAGLERVSLLFTPSANGVVLFSDLVVVVVVVVDVVVLLWAIMVEFNILRYSAIVVALGSIKKH